MSDEVRRHYDDLLAPIYSWTLGSVEARADATAQLLEEVLGTTRLEGKALDLGCGTGVQTLALARFGLTCTGVDFSRVALEEYARRTEHLGTESLVGDLAELDVGDGYTLALCFGDTVSHLQSWSDVQSFFRRVLRSLVPGGHFVLASRDHARVYRGDERFLLVRADERRTMTCVLDDEGERVRVTDVVHERDERGETTMRVSSYSKLRVSPGTLSAELASAGFSHVKTRPGAGGVYVFHARKATS